MPFDPSKLDPAKVEFIKKFNGQDASDVQAASFDPSTLTPHTAEFVAKSDGSDVAPQIIQKQPEDISNLDRFKIANFSNDPQASMAYLRDKYPNYEVGLVNDQIGLRKKGDEGPYQALMPKVQASDVWKDPGKVLHRATDFTTDVGSGILSSGAAGLAAAPLLETGPGALAAGSAAGGAASAGLEGLRQGLGKYFGVNKDIQAGPIAVQGVSGAAAPLLFGAGPAKGAIGAGYDFASQKVFPKIGQAISGVPAKTILTASEKMPEIKKLEQEGVTDFAEKAHENISQGLQDAKTKVGQQIQAGIEGAGGSIDASAAKKPFEDLLNKLQTQWDNIKTPEVKEKMKDVADQLKYYFSKEPVKDPTTGQLVLDSYGNPVTEVMSLSPQQAFGLKQSMADLGDLDKVKATGIKSSLSGMSPAQKEIAIAARKSKSALDEGIGQAVDAADSATGGMSNLRSQYRDLNNMQDYLEPYFKTPEKTYNTMRNMGGKNKEVLMESLQNMDQKYGTNSMDNAKTLDAYNYFGNPTFNPLSSGGTTSTTRSIPLAGVGLGAGYYLGNKIHAGPLLGGLGMMAGGTMGSPAALRQYMNVGSGIRAIGNALSPVAPAVGQAGLNLYNRQDNMAPQSPWSLFPNQQGVQQ